MGDWPDECLGFEKPPGTTIAIPHDFCLGEVAGGGAPGDTSANWPAAKLILYLPFTLVVPVEAVKMAVLVGGTTGGNLDLGIYDLYGNRIVSSGSTAVGSISTIQVVDITDTWLNPSNYFIAMQVDSTTPRFNRYNTVTAGLQEFYGVQQEAASVFGLPDPATFAQPANAYVPLPTILLNTTV